MKQSNTWRGFLALGMGLVVLMASANVKNATSLPVQGKSTPVAMHAMDGKRGIRYSTDDERDPVLREKMRLERRAMTGSAATSTAMRQQAPAETYTVTCIFEGEDWPYFAIYNEDLFVETRYSIWEEMDQEDTYYFQIPAGVYDISSSFWNYQEQTHAYIVHENVEISGETTIRFSKDEATETIFIQPMLRNGSPMQLSIGKYLDEEPWIEYDDSQKNAEYLATDFLLFKEGCEAIAAGMSMQDFCTADEPAGIKMMTSKLSDNYHLLVYAFIQTDDETAEISTSDINGLKTGTFDTYIKGFQQCPMPQFSETPLFYEEGCEKYRSAVSGYYWVDNVQTGGGGVYMQTITPTVYVTTQPSTVVDLKTVVWPTSVQEYKMVIVEEYDPEEDETFTYKDWIIGEMVSVPIWYNGKDWEYINQNHSQCGNYSYQVPAEGPVLEYPGLEPYCFTPAEITKPFGNSSPITVIMTQVHDIDGMNYIIFEPQAWIGRYGEVRNCDRLMTTTTVMDAKGEVLYKDEDGYFDEWKWDYFTTPHEKGVLKAIFNDTNVLVDGEVKGFNRTEITFDETKDDTCTPTPQMLIFKNVSGAITDRFGSASDGVIEFSAGDFNWFDDGDRWGYTVEEADVLVEYAPYGEETWQPIEVEEVPEYFYMPGFGYFYRGSLGCVDQPSSNGWYDLRMTLTDKAGNRTMEHISPAFKIGEGSGVKSTPVDGVNVWVADGQIRTNCADIASIELFTLDGRLVAKTTGPAPTSLSVDGLTGALLVRLTTVSGAVTTHKLLL